MYWTARSEHVLLHTKMHRYGRCIAMAEPLLFSRRCKIGGTSDGKSRHVFPPNVGYRSHQVCFHTDVGNGPAWIWLAVIWSRSARNHVHQVATRPQPFDCKPDPGRAVSNIIRRPTGQVSNAQPMQHMYSNGIAGSSTQLRQTPRGKVLDTDHDREVCVGALTPSGPQPNGKSGPTPLWHGRRLVVYYP
jgi:hypothetical protein